MAQYLLVLLLSMGWTQTPVLLDASPGRAGELAQLWRVEPAVLRLSVAASAEGEGIDHEIVLTEQLRPGATIEAARVIPFHHQAWLLALVVREDGGTTYRYLHNAVHSHPLDKNADGWLLSDPIFRTDDDPAYALASVRNPGGDHIEIVFQRGVFAPVGSPSEKTSVKLFVDSCPIFRRALQAGRSRLVSLVVEGEE